MPDVPKWNFGTGDQIVKNLQSIQIQANIWFEKKLKVYLNDLNDYTVFIYYAGLFFQKFYTLTELTTAYTTPDTAIDTHATMEPKKFIKGQWHYVIACNLYDTFKKFINQQKASQLNAYTATAEWLNKESKPESPSTEDTIGKGVKTEEEDQKEKDDQTGGDTTEHTAEKSSSRRKVGIMVGALSIVGIAISLYFFSRNSPPSGEQKHQTA